MKKIEHITLSMKNINEQVHLYGWVAKKRNLGGLIFIDLRDRSGIIQLVIRPESSFYNVAETVKSEFVLEVKGIVKERESKNPKLATGDIEVEVTDFKIINAAIDIPFEITTEASALEDTRLKYRYLDIRREPIKNNLITRHKITMSVRNYLDKMGFLEVETPILCKSTPEGARDYLVPSRVNKGKFFALPQSPQLFKQLLMVGGIEKYFQIAKCFRDEDLRADRQPEFTQVDVEMSFVNENDVMSVGEGLIASMFKEVKGIDIKLPIQRMKYDDAIKYYGSDKPDLRFDMKIEDLTHIFVNTEFAMFKNIIDANGVINAIVVKNAADKYSRKDLDNLTEYVKTYKLNGLAYLKVADEITGSIAKSVTKEELDSLTKEFNLSNNDLLLISFGNYKTVKNGLGQLRLKVARDLNLIPEGIYSMLWVVDFPLFEYSEEDKRYYAAHHPFTSPKDEDMDKITSDQGNCYAKAYDIVINGYEAGGGSIRIHNNELQNKMFEALGFNQEEIDNKFGFLIDAFKYGTPPHGGFALGLDRLTMLMANTDNIRDVIAFPKTASASDLMTSAPNDVDLKQLRELAIEIKK